MSEICRALKNTCIFATKEGGCTADYRMSCIEALIMTGMVEND